MFEIPYASQCYNLTLTVLGFVDHIQGVLGYVGGSVQEYAAFVQDGIREGFATPWEISWPGWCWATKILAKN